MPSPSPYLDSSLSRLSDRANLIRRDVELMLEGVKVKGLFLDDLRQKVRKHREEDVAQLNDARRDTWASWEERLKRLEKWMAQAANLSRDAGNLRAWQQSALGFDRAVNISQKFTRAMDQKARDLQKRIASLAEKMQQWSDRLRLKEAELREFAERQAVKTTEIQVSKARKQPLLDFLFAEREEEGRLALEFKTIRSSANRMLERLTRADEWAILRLEANPSQFEARKVQLLESWRAYHPRFNELREAVLHHALDFEESRRRLRWIYEQVQRMRVVQDTPPARRPLLERFFRPEE